MPSEDARTDTHPVLSAVVLGLLMLICLAFGLVCWDAAHVTYYVPIRHPVGAPAVVGARHDLLGRPMTGAVVCLVIAVLVVPLGIVATRRQWPWLGVAVFLSPLIALVVAIRATHGPPQVY